MSSAKRAARRKGGGKKTSRNGSKAASRSGAKKAFRSAPGKHTRKGPKSGGIGAEERKRIRHILDGLQALYPDARCALDYQDPLQLMVATILSAQCTDVRVNIVTRDLFRKYRRPEDYLEVPQGELEDDIRTTGFYSNKARNIRDAMQKILERHGGRVPETMEELVELGGVGRKTANVVLGECFETAGIVVDTHVKRLTNRLGLTREQDPVKIEFDLMEKIPRDRWTLFSHQVIQHGRAVCRARRPACETCELEPLCPKVGL